MMFLILDCLLQALDGDADDVDEFNLMTAVPLRYREIVQRRARAVGEFDSRLLSMVKSNGVTIAKSNGIAIGKAME